MNASEKLRFQAKQHIRHTRDDASSPLQLRERRLLANIVRAASEGLNIRAGVDVAACAISRIVDPADLFFAIGTLID
jgi:hypothetical protein